MNGGLKWRPAGMQKIIGSLLILFHMNGNSEKCINGNCQDVEKLPGIHAASGCIIG
jgi:hypothetical protein